MPGQMHSHSQKTKTELTFFSGIVYRLRIWMFTVHVSFHSVETLWRCTQRRMSSRRICMKWRAKCEVGCLRFAEWICLFFVISLSSMWPMSGLKCVSFSSIKNIVTQYAPRVSRATKVRVNNTFHFVNEAVIFFHAPSTVWTERCLANKSIRHQKWGYKV